MKLSILFRPQRLWLLLAAGVMALFLLAVLTNVHIKRVTAPFIFSRVEDVPKKQVALVLGARVYANGKLADTLLDREKTAIALYEHKKVEKILVSGDHGRKDYDEVNAMKDYLLAHGIPARDIFLDHAGFDTYDSVYRAKTIFGVTSMIIVTQEFHLPRALYIATSLDLDAVGAVADLHEYVAAAYNDRREVFARVKAFLDVTLHASPKFLGPAIPITGDSALSWDKK